MDVFSNSSYILGPFLTLLLFLELWHVTKGEIFMTINPLCSLKVPFHAAGLIEPNQPVTVHSVAKPIFETMQAGANYIVDKLTPSKLVKAGILFGTVQALSSAPVADAGFLCFSWCMAICLGSSTGTGGAFAPCCTAACIAFCGPTPTP